MDSVDSCAIETSSNARENSGIIRFDFECIELSYTQNAWCYVAGCNTTQAKNMTTQTWYIILFVIIFILIARVFPKAAIGLAIIVLLLWLFKAKGK